MQVSFFSPCHPIILSPHHLVTLSSSPSPDRHLNHPTKNGPSQSVWIGDFTKRRPGFSARDRIVDEPQIKWRGINEPRVAKRKCVVHAKLIRIRQPQRRLAR